MTIYLNGLGFFNMPNSTSGQSHAEGDNAEPVRPALVSEGALACGHRRG